MTLGPDTTILLNLWTLIAVIIFAIAQAVKFTTYRNKIDFRIKNLETENEHQELCIRDVIKKVNDADVTFMEIKTKLANIETLLMDMKTQIKNKK
jgi:hypothetical protein